MGKLGKLMGSKLVGSVVILLSALAVCGTCMKFLNGGTPSSGTPSVDDKSILPTAAVPVSDRKSLKREKCGDSGDFYVCVMKTETRRNLCDSTGACLRATKGSEFRLVYVSVSHKGKKEKSAGLTDLLLVDGVGNQYSPDRGDMMIQARVAGYELFKTYEFINPRSAVGGWLVYLVPTDASDLHVLAKLGWGNKLELSLASPPGKPGAKEAAK